MNTGGVNDFWDSTGDRVILWPKIFLVVVVLMGAAFVGEAHAQIPDVVKIAILLPLSGEIFVTGAQLSHAAELAIADFNSYLKENGFTWSLEAVYEDTESNPVRALEKVQILHTRGIGIIVGPVASAQLSHMLPYINNNNVMVISPTSTASALAIADDAVFRTVPNDINQARAIGATLKHWGIEAIVPMWRGEAYGDGFIDAVVSDFESRGGITHDGVRYNPTGGDFSVSVSVLADLVSETVDRYGADRIAVVLASFDEAILILQAASVYDILDDVRWIAGEGVAKSTAIASDPIAAQFAVDTRLHNLQLFLNLGGRADSISDYVYERLGGTPIFHIYTIYDAVWLAGLSILEANSSNPADVRKVIRDVSVSYSDGALSSVELNAAGDLMLSNYEMWVVSEDGWVKSLVYDGQSDSIRQTRIVDGTVFAPDYVIQGGSVLNMYTNPQEAALIVEIMADVDGMLNITLPRGLVDSQTGEGADSGFFVLINGEEISYEETGVDDDSRTLSVGFAAGTDKIEIIGTSAAVPEIEEIGMLVLAAGLVLVAVISTIYRTNATRPLLNIR